MNKIDSDPDFAPEEDDYETEIPGRGQRLPLMVLAIVLVAAGIILGLLYGLSGNNSPAAAAPEGVPVQPVPDLASPNTTASGAPVGVITCRGATNQIVRYHIHILVHLFVDGQQVRIPAGAGIPAPRTVEHIAGGVFLDNSPSGCLYWLHVHANDGIIHVEAPYKATFTLGQFFDVWRQPLGPDQVGPARGTVTAFINGSRFNGDPRNLPLLPHAVVQLDVGTPVVPFMPAQFNVKGLCGAGSGSCAAK